MFVPCRLYMVGGGEARGTPDDTVAIYTPMVDGGWCNVTLPFGYFSSLALEPMGSVTDVILSL